MNNANTITRSLSDLVDEVARATNQPAKTVKPIIQATLDAITNGVTTGARYQLSGFGSFEARQRNARTGINPQTKAKMTIPASTVAAFKPASTWSSRLNPNKAKKQQPDNVLVRERGG